MDSSLCVFQEWHFQSHVKEGFTAPVHRQINVPVQRGLMEMYLALVKNGSAYGVTPGCTVKEQVKDSQPVYFDVCLSCILSLRGGKITPVRVI